MFVSVLMPVRNEADFIRRSLGAVLEQDYPRELMEVIVIDGMSTDATREIVGEIAETDSRVRLLDNPKQIAPTALNIGTRESKGEVVIRIDGHCEIAKDYVSRCVEHLENGEADGVGGPIKTIGEGFVAKAIAIAMSSKFGVGGSAFRTIDDRNIYVDTIAFPAYKRSVIETVGGYDGEMVRNQDDEYNFRLRKMGFKLLLAADVRSRYHSRATVRKMISQFAQYGFWKVRVLQKHPRQMSLRHFIPSVFVLSLLVFLIATLFSPLGLIFLGAVFGSHLLINLLFSLSASIREGIRFSLILPFIFLAIHLSYGAGMLAGLLKFITRWRDFGSNVDSVEASI